MTREEFDKVLTDRYGELCRFARSRLSRFHGLSARIPFPRKDSLGRGRFDQPVIGTEELRQGRRSSDSPAGIEGEELVHAVIHDILDKHPHRCVACKERLPKKRLSDNCPSCGVCVPRHYERSIEKPAQWVKGWIKNYCKRHVDEAGRFVRSSSVPRESDEPQDYGTDQSLEDYAPACDSLEAWDAIKPGQVMHAVRTISEQAGVTQLPRRETVCQSVDRALKDCVPAGVMRDVVLFVYGAGKTWTEAAQRFTPKATPSQLQRRVEPYVAALRVALRHYDRPQRKEVRDDSRAVA
jgi:hypothetical protein